MRTWTYHGTEAPRSESGQIAKRADFMPEANRVGLEFWRSLDADQRTRIACIEFETASHEGTARKLIFTVALKPCAESKEWAEHFARKAA